MTAPAGRRALQRTAADRYENAERAGCLNHIAAHAAGPVGENPESTALNVEAFEAARHISRWRRYRISRRVIRETDYWRLTGQETAFIDNALWYLSLRFIGGIVRHRRCARVLAAVAAAGTSEEKQRIMQDLDDTPPWDTWDTALVAGLVISVLFVAVAAGMTIWSALPAGPAGPPGPVPSVFCPAGQHVTAIRNGYPECAR